MTTFVDKFAITVAQNEALAQPFDLTVDNGNGLQIPFDLTNAVFHAQVRKRRSTDSELLATLEVEITDAVNGSISLNLDQTVTTALTPGAYSYDLLVSVDDGPIENLWASTFVVEPGVTVWPTP